ncbi:PEP-CTERM sorting domain-containing protein [Roseateles sp.]|uniref:PEP-CTERM sorting domain-containing protein n=1 Tax=Roseateles sp. TaxID=1971397 RepID=UPI00286A85F8|nr:PEP-CTERM sorting domain-containing protein [Roseateles sp.]
MRTIHLTVAAIALAAASAVSAQTTVYTSSASFLPNVLAGSYTEGFENNIDFSGEPSFDFSGGAFGYTVAAPTGLYGNGVFIGTNLPNEPLTVTFTGAPVTAVGGNFYATNISDVFQPVSITLTLSNGHVTTFMPTSPDNSYRGFTTALSITSLTLSAPGASLYVGMDNLTVGAVPEPGTYAMMALGLAALGGFAARRHQQGQAA